MSIYAAAALKARCFIVQDRITPSEAWSKAVATVTISKSSREKGCPKTTFLALANAGYLKDVRALLSSQKRGHVLRERAIAAANIVLSRPEIEKKDLADELGYSDRQGAYDIVLALAKQGVLCRPTDESTNKLS